MSLDFDCSKIENFDDVPWGLAETIIFSTMIVGLGEITEANAEKFYARVHAFEITTAGTLTNTIDGETLTPRPTTPADIRSMIGLTTNVFPAESDAKFAKKVLGWATDTARREWKASQS